MSKSKAEKVVRAIRNMVERSIDLDVDDVIEGDALIIVCTDGARVKVTIEREGE